MSLPYFGYCCTPPFPPSPPLHYETLGHLVTAIKKNDVNYIIYKTSLK